MTVTRSWSRVLTNLSVLFCCKSVTEIFLLKVTCDEFSLCLQQQTVVVFTHRIDIFNIHHNVHRLRGKLESCDKLDKWSWFTVTTRDHRMTATKKTWSHRVLIVSTLFWLEDVELLYLTTEIPSLLVSKYRWISSRNWIPSDYNRY